MENEQNKLKPESGVVRFFRKRRVGIMNATDRTEEWYFHMSPAGFMAACVAVVLVLFIAVSLLVSYTPFLEFLPGYRASANRSREGLIANIMRMDSMERQMRDMLTYNQNIALIMDGKMPVVRTIAGADTTRLDKTLVMPSYEDSLLRAQMEGDGPYSLASTTSQRSGSGRVEMTAPVSGVVTSHFSIADSRFGMTIAASAEAPVSAVAAGTVVVVSWSPESGHMIVVQHDRNLVTIYKQLANATVSAGQRVSAGEVIGYNSGTADDDSLTGQIEFELWDDGKPVDPMNYIIF